MIQVNVKFDESLLEAIDKCIDPTIGQTRSLFVRESVKKHLSSLGIEVKKND